MALGYSLEISATIAESDDECIFILTIRGLPDRREAEVISAWVQNSLRNNTGALTKIEGNGHEAGHA